MWLFVLGFCVGLVTWPVLSTLWAIVHFFRGNLV